jgi:hypothetical protein
MSGKPRRFVIVAALVLVALYVVGPQPHVTWRSAITGSAAVWGGCPADYGYLVPPGATDPYGVGTSPSSEGVCRNGSAVSLTRPAVIAPAVTGQSEEHRIALYLVALKWRLFDVTFSSDNWNGFAVGATYR